MKLTFWGTALVLLLGTTQTFARDAGVQNSEEVMDVSDLQSADSFAQVDAMADFLGFKTQAYDGRRPPRPPPPPHRPPPHRPPPPPYYPPPHRPPPPPYYPPPPPPPIYYYTCYAEDMYNRVFWARDQYARWAQDTAMMNCQRYSYGCRPTGCRLD